VSSRILEAKTRPRGQQDWLWLIIGQIFASDRGGGSRFTLTPSLDVIHANIAINDIDEN